MSPDLRISPSRQEQIYRQQSRRDFGGAKLLVEASMLDGVKEICSWRLTPSGILWAHDPIRPPIIRVTTDYRIC